MEFKESRYIEALGISTNASGDMKIDQEIITLTYESPKPKTMIFKSSSVKNISQMGIKTLHYKDNPKFEYIYKLMQAVYLKKYELIKPYFNITKTDNTTIFQPRELIREIFAKVELKEDKEEMILNIYMNSGDRITIESKL